MTLMTRLARWVRADLHAVLDRLEDPESTLRQSLREMEAALTNDQQNLQALDQRLARLSARRLRVAEDLHALEARIQACLARGEDDLARPLLRRQLEWRRMDEGLRAQEDELSRSRTEQTARIAERRETLERLRLHADLEREPAPTAVEDPALSILTPISEAEVELALAEARQRGAR